jgi:15-cis-phytoene synthase
MNRDRSIDTYTQARNLTRRNARTFYFASHSLPPEKRRASYALYAFCRYVDNIADAESNVQIARCRIKQVKTLLESMYDAPFQVREWVALQETIERYGIPKQYLLDLVEGVEMDLDGFSCRTFSDLQRYCYHVASVVGLMMTKILQPDNEAALPYAEHLGTAMQLTNILRDIGEDLRMQRRYIPADELQASGIGVEHLDRQQVNTVFREFMQHQITRARDYYAKAEPGVSLLPDDGSRYCVRVMSVLYSRILDAIEANGYDVFSRRAHVPLSIKLRLAASIALFGDSKPYLPGRHMVHQPLRRLRAIDVDIVNVQTTRTCHDCGTQSNE